MNVKCSAKCQDHEIKMLSAVLALADSTLLLSDVVGCAVHIALSWSHIEAHLHMLMG